MDASLQHKLAMYETFWRGDGPCLILIPAETQEMYDLRNYPARFHDPQAMWEAEMHRARAAVDWPTDGIPCVRPNLGVVWIPAMAGLSYRLPEDAMPWPGEALSCEAIRAARLESIPDSETMRLAEAFYAIHHEANREDIVAYQADTQGVFDIAHLLYGDALFYDLPNPDCAAWVAELLQIARDFYTRATLHIKEMLGESANTMIHGHGTCQGVFFPTAGARSAEDTVTLIGPDMIESLVLPQINETAATFGGIFVHFCGKHPTLLKQLCGQESVHAIDLGNPEMFDPRSVMELCAATNTVLHSRIAALPGESWQPYVQRIATLVCETGARVILRPMVIPGTRDECAAMLQYWHENT